jgi:hypothetical protein
MTIQNTRFPKSLFTLVALSCCFVFTGAARADHDYDILRAKADAVFHAMIDMDRTLVDSYVRSRVFGEMMATSGKIKGKAAYLRGMSYHNSPCRWSREIEELDGLVHQMEALIENAHFRADRGLDPPISFCAIEAGRRLAAIIGMVHCMESALEVIHEPVYPVINYRPACPAGNPGPGTPGHYNHDGYDIEDYGYGRRNSTGERSAGYRGDRGFGNGAINRHGQKGGNVRLGGGGVTFGAGGLAFRINF